MFLTDDISIVYRPAAIWGALTFVCLIDSFSDPVCVQRSSCKRYTVLVTHLFLSVHFPVKVLEETKICEDIQAQTETHAAPTHTHRHLYLYT